MLHSGKPKGATVDVAVAVLLLTFDSLLALTVAVFEMLVPAAAVLSTWTMRVKVAVAPEEKVERVLVIVPVPPTAGVVFDHPTGAVNETKVVLTGTRSVSETLVASDGPLLASAIV